MKKGFIFFVLTLLGLVGVAQSPSEKLSSLLQNMKTFHAKFEEKSQGNTQKGELWIQRPSKFLWKVSAPSSEWFLSDGAFVYHFDADLMEVTQTSLSSSLDQTPLLLLSGSIKSLSTEFTVDQPSADHFHLTPTKNTEESGLIESIDFVFSNGKMASFSMQSRLGQKTTVTFSNVEWNPALSQALFVFKRPLGADEIFSSSF